MKARLGHIWQRVGSNAAAGISFSEETTDFISNGKSYTLSRDIREPRRVLMFHIAAILDLNEFGLNFLDCTDSEMEEFKEFL